MSECKELQDPGFNVDFYFKLQEVRLFFFRRKYCRMGMKEKKDIFSITRFFSCFCERIVFAMVSMGNTPILVISPRTNFEDMFDSENKPKKKPQKVNRNWRDGI
jgi:hypothetical protein